MTSKLATQPAAAGQESPADLFQYGWRYVRKIKPDGSTELEQVPLTLEDVLHPQEEDVIPERPVQERERGYLAAVFRSRLPRLTGGLVLSDCIVNWGVPGVRSHSPDVAVFADLQVQPNSERGTFHLLPSGGRCLLALEIVSPDTRNNDIVRKLSEYFQAKIPLYIIVDQEADEEPRQLLAYRRTPRCYKLIRPDHLGRVPLEPLGLRLGLRDNGVVCYDAQTEKEVGDYTQVTRALENAEQHIMDLEAELRRLRGKSSS